MLNYIKNEIAIWLSHFFFVPLQHEKISKYGTRKKISFIGRPFSYVCIMSLKI